MKSVKRTIAVILLATFYKISEISYKKKRKQIIKQRMKIRNLNSCVKRNTGFKKSNI